MKLAPNTRYAVRLLFELDAAGVPLSISVLSRKTGLTPRVVENIHAILKRQGATVARVGAGGGIALKKPLEEISLGELVDWFEDGVEFRVCCGEKANECPQQDACETRLCWSGVSGRIRGMLHTVRLADIVRPKTV